MFYISLSDEFELSDVLQSGELTTAKSPQWVSSRPSSQKMTGMYRYDHIPFSLNIRPDN